MKVAFVSTFLPERCGLASYAGWVVPIIEQTVEVQPVRLPYGATFLPRPKVPVRIKSRVDLVHINYEYALYGQNIIPLLLWLRLKRIPVVLTLHCFNSYNWPNRYLNFWINRLAKKIVVHSPEIARRHGYVHIPLGGPDNPYLRQGRRGRESGPSFVHTGFVRENKRLDDIIRVFSRRQDLPLVICGTHQSGEPTPYYQGCRDLFEGNSGNITWHDRYMNEDELLRVYADGDVLVIFHSPVQENFHSALVGDALASGLPIVATPLPGIREQIPDKCGYLLAGFDISDLDIGLDVAKDRYREWQETLAGMRTNFLWENIAGQYISIYQELLNNRQS